jgi:hypothetical protein
MRLDLICLFAACSSISRYMLVTVRLEDVVSVQNKHASAMPVYSNRAFLCCLIGQFSCHRMSSKDWPGPDQGSMQNKMR